MGQGRGIITLFYFKNAVPVMICEISTTQIRRNKIKEHDINRTEGQAREILKRFNKMVKCKVLHTS